MKFGDNVKIVKNAETTQAELDGKVGQIYGETTPSITNTPVIGKLNRDFAFNVYFKESDQNIWFAEECLEFIDHGAGTDIKVGDSNFKLDKDGNWVKQEL